MYYLLKYAHIDKDWPFIGFDSCVVAFTRKNETGGNIQAHIMCTTEAAYLLFFYHQFFEV